MAAYCLPRLLGSGAGVIGRRAAAVPFRRRRPLSRWYHGDGEIQVPEEDPLLVKKIEKLAEKQVLRDFTRRSAKEMQMCTVAPNFKAIALSWLCAGLPMFFLTLGCMEGFVAEHAKNNPAAA